MKKMILMAAMFFTVVAPAVAHERVEEEWSWENRPSSVTITIGAPSMTTIVLANMSRRWSDRRSPSYYGAYSIRYDYNILRWLAVGGSLSYDGWERIDIETVRNEKAGTITTSQARYAGHRASVLMGVRFTYINREHVQLYSGLALGMSMYWEYDNSYWDHPMQVAGSVVPVGVHVGSQKVYGMAEVSVGTESMMSIGIGFHL